MTLTQEKLIESFLLFPTISTLELIQDSDNAISLLMNKKDSTEKLHFLYNVKRITSFDLVKQTLRDNSKLFYSYIDDLKMDRTRLKELVDIAVKYNASSEISYLKKLGASYSIIAESAIKYKKKKLLNDVILKGATNWNEMARVAAQYGRLDLLQTMIKNGANDWELIACGAAEGGNSELAREMLKKCNKSRNIVASAAAEAGDMDLMIETLDAYNDDPTFILEAAVRAGSLEIVEYLQYNDYVPYDDCCNEEMLALAAKCGHHNIVNHILSFEAFMFNIAAVGAAEGGHKELVLGLLDNVDNYDEVVQAAVKGGDREILDLVAARVTNWNKVKEIAKEYGNENIV